MAVKIRLTRMGAKKRPFYRIVATDSRTKRDGEYLEQIGTNIQLKEKIMLKSKKRLLLNG